MSSPEKKGAAEISPDLAATTSSTTPAITESQPNKNTSRTGDLQDDPNFDVISLILPEAFRELHPGEDESFPCPTARQVVGMPLRYFVGANDEERETNRERCAWGLYYEEDITPAEWWANWQAEQKAEGERNSAWWAENAKWNREIFAELERTRLERFARLAGKHATETDLDALLDYVDTAWLAACEEPWQDRTSYFCWTIITISEMTRLLARILHERAETPGDEAIAFIMDNGLRDPRAAIAVERVWRAHLLALQEAPIVETVTAFQIEFYTKLADALCTAGLMKVRTS
jgi:hypothetical protein